MGSDHNTYRPSHVGFSHTVSLRPHNNHVRWHHGYSHSTDEENEAQSSFTVCTTSFPLADEQQRRSPSPGRSDPEPTLTTAPARLLSWATTSLSSFLRRQVHVSLRLHSNGRHGPDCFADHLLHFATYHVCFLTSTYVLCHCF